MPLQTSPVHDAATTMLHCGGGVKGVIPHVDSYDHRTFFYVCPISFSELWFIYLFSVIISLFSGHSYSKTIFLESES